MNIFQTGSGTLYGALVLASAIYLLWGFRIELRSLLKAVIAAQILGDFIFSSLLQELPVLRFIKWLTMKDRFMPLFIMMGCIIMMDLGAALLGRRQRLVTSPGFSARGSESISRWARTVQRIAPPGIIQFDPKLGKKIGYAFIAFAVIAKMIAIAASGVLSSPSIVHAILAWQPEDLVGLAYLDVSSLLMFPIGVALVAMSSKPHPHMKALAAMTAFSILSPWKADAIKMALIYGLAVSHFGMQELKEIFWSKRALAALLAIVFIFSVKAQYRYTGEASTDPGSLMGGFLATTSYRFMGGTFQTFSYVVGSVENGGAPLMAGEYNGQALYMWIPRQLWPNKPRFAAERIYDYLDLVPEIDGPYGTAFCLSVFGTFYIDFGKWMSLLCSFVLGLFLAGGDRLLLQLREQGGRFSGIKYLTLSTIWLNSLYSLSEAGLPAAIPTLLCGAAALYFVLLIIRAFEPSTYVLRLAR